MRRGGLSCWVSTPPTMGGRSRTGRMNRSWQVRCRPCVPCSDEMCVNRWITKLPAGRQTHLHGGHIHSMHWVPHHGCATIWHNALTVRCFLQARRRNASIMAPSTELTNRACGQRRKSWSWHDRIAQPGAPADALQRPLVPRAAEPGCFTCRGGRQAFGSPSPAQVSAAFGYKERRGWTHSC